MVEPLYLPPSNPATTLWPQASLLQQTGLTALSQQVLQQRGPEVGSDVLGNAQEPRVAAHPR